MLLYASCIDVDDKGVLIRGKSGSGKTDLCLRFMREGHRLVADDQVVLDEKDGILWASCPKTIQGQIEVRGLGIVRVPFKPLTKLSLIIDLVPRSKVERMPVFYFFEMANCRVPIVQINAFDVSAIFKIELALQQSETFFLE